MSGNRQLFVTLISGIGVFLVNLGISFLLTPYIVNKLGTAAYGFIGLTNDILGYSSLLTIAINSMAGRFITVKIHGGDIRGANIYLSSVFYTNLVLSFVILLLVIISAIWLEYLINIPPELVFDVKFLYILLGVSMCLGLMTGIIGVSMFICNRLDISNVRNMIGSFLRVGVLLFLFGFFVPRLWYFGVTALIMNIYLISSNIHYFKILVPGLSIEKKLFSIKSVIRIASVGAWNIINKVSSLLTRGCELLLTNIFVSAKAMGQLSLALAVPHIILSFFGTISSSFSPELTRYYAIKDTQMLEAELMKAIRICSFFSAIPLAICYSMGDVFFSLWLPNSNINLLYILSIVGSIELTIGLPLEPIWGIFVVTNRVKQSSLYQLSLAIVTFVLIILSMFLFKDDSIKLILIAGIHSVLCVYRNLTFLPRFGAKCIGVSSKIFYPIILKNILTLILITVLGFILKTYLYGTDPSVYHASWIGFFSSVFALLLVGSVICNFVFLRKEDRARIAQKIRAIL